MSATMSEARAIVVTTTPEQCRAELAGLLGRLGMSVGELRERAAEYTLSPDEHVAYRRVEELLWLLGDHE